MQSILEVVLPIFALILTGYIAGNRGILGRDSSVALNGFVFYFALPIVLFLAMARIEVANVFNAPYIVAYLAGQIVTIALGVVLARSVFRLSAPQAATHGTVSIYGNVGYMGIPLALTAFGPDVLPPVVIATIINAALNIAILTAVIEAGRQESTGFAALRKVSVSVFGSPILVAPILGLGWAFLGFSIPVPLQTYGSILGAAAGPCALFSIGLSLVGLPLSEGRAEVASMTVLKLVVHPLVTLAIAFPLLRDQPQMLVICVLMAALPTGANLYVLVQRYGLYVARTSTAILATTTLSLLTLSFLFYLLERAGIETLV